MRTHSSSVPGQERAQVDDFAADAVLLLHRLRLKRRRHEVHAHTINQQCPALRCMSTF